jgi:hypothetical protein
VADELFPDIEDIDEAEFLDTFPDEDFLEEEAEPPLEFGITWKFDFTTGDVFTDDVGRMVIVSEEATLHEWLGHTLNTERFETPIFGGDIGTDINEIIGAESTFDPYTSAIIEDDFRETILVHDRVDTVETVAVIPLDYDMFVYMRVITDSGATLEEVANF